MDLVLSRLFCGVFPPHAIITEFARNPLLKHLPSVDPFAGYQQQDRKPALTCSRTGTAFCNAPR